MYSHPFIKQGHHWPPVGQQFANRNSNVVICSMPLRCLTKFRFWIQNLLPCHFCCILQAGDWWIGSVLPLWIHLSWTIFIHAGAQKDHRCTGRLPVPFIFCFPLYLSCVRKNGYGFSSYRLLTYNTCYVYICSLFKYISQSVWKKQRCSAIQLPVWVYQILKALSSKIILWLISLLCSFLIKYFPKVDSRNVTTALKMSWLHETVHIIHVFCCMDLTFYFRVIVYWRCPQVQGRLSPFSLCCLHITRYEVV